MPANNRKNPFLLAPASAFAVLVLLLIFGFLEGDGGAKTSVLSVIFTLIAFGVPTAFLFLLRGARAAEIFPVRRLKKGDALLLIAAVLSLSLLTATLKYALFRVDFDYHKIALYGFSLSFPDSFGEWLLALFAVAVIPAVMEELLFRGAFFYEYRRAGVLASALISSLAAGLMGLSFGSFPLIFICSLFFAAVRFLTGNLLVSFLLHLAYGIYTISFEKYVWLMSCSEESRVLFLFLIVVCLGASLIWFLHLAEKMLRERARAQEDAPIRMPKGKEVLVVFDMLTAPSLWMLLCAYLIIAVIALFI